MEETADEIMARMHPVAQQVAASLPPLPPVVYVVLAAAVEYDDEVYYEGEGTTFIGAFASESRAREEAQKHDFVVDKDTAAYMVQQENIKASDLEANGTFLFKAMIQEVRIQ